MATKKKFAGETVVPIEKSEAEIKATLSHFGAVDVVIGNRVRDRAKHRAYMARHNARKAGLPLPELPA